VFSKAFWAKENRNLLIHFLNAVLEPGQGKQKEKKQAEKKAAQAEESLRNLCANAEAEGNKDS